MGFIGSTCAALPGTVNLALMRSVAYSAVYQGLPLVHFSAQPETSLATEALKSPSVSLKWCLR